MASLLRMAARQGSQILRSTAVIRRQTIQPACFISTSKKNKDSIAVSDTSKMVDNDLPAEEDPNWISYGFNLVDKGQDYWEANMLMFFGITVAICGGGFILAYWPDHRLQDWSQREAFLQLAYRENNGLPLIDSEVIPIKNLNLPSDEELGDFEIII